MSSCVRSSRDIGHGFTTTSDTEVIAHAYEQWGVEFLHRLNGDFAIAIWDRRGKSSSSREIGSGSARSSSARTAETSASGQRRRHYSVILARRGEIDPAGRPMCSPSGRRCPDRSAFLGIRELPAQRTTSSSPRTGGAAREALVGSRLRAGARMARAIREQTSSMSSHALLYDSGSSNSTAGRRPGRHLPERRTRLVPDRRTRRQADAPRETLHAFGVGF